MASTTAGRGFWRGIGRWSGFSSAGTDSAGVTARSGSFGTAVGDASAWPPRSPDAFGADVPTVQAASLQLSERGPSTSAAAEGREGGRSPISAAAALQRIVGRVRRRPAHSSARLCTAAQSCARAALSSATRLGNASPIPGSSCGSQRAPAALVRNEVRAKAFVARVLPMLVAHADCSSARLRRFHPWAMPF